MNKHTHIIVILLLLISWVSVIFAADNSIIVEQIGNNNTVTVTQEGSGNSVSITTGKTSDVDGTYISVLQQGNNKTSTVEIKSGINNTIYLTQQDAGNHTANIQNLNGNANSISITQQGAGGHEFSVIGAVGATNSNNSITAAQSGGVGSEKWFNLNMNGAVGATVNVQQHGSGQNQSSMNVQCAAGACGNYNFSRY